MPNISDLAPEPSDCGTVVIRGPKGDKGDQGEPGSTALLVDDPITADGSGTQSDPYVIGLGLSADANNTLSIGGDGGLYAPVADGSETIVTAGTGTAVTGTGTADDSYVIASTVTAADLGAITTVTGTGGVTATTDGTDVTVSADVSAADGNQLAVNADGGLYVAAQTAIGDNTYLVGDGLAQSGTGTAEDPYILAVSLSADAGNALTVGTDGGLYVPDVAAGVSSVTAADATVTVTPAEGDVTVAANISADTGNHLETGTDGALYVPGTDVTADPGLTVSGDAGSGYTLGLAGVYGYCALRTALTTSATWQDVPLTLAAGQGMTVSGDMFRLGQPGVWFITAQINANGSGAAGNLYVTFQDTEYDNYASTYLDGTDRRYAAITNSMIVSDGSTVSSVRCQFTRNSGTKWPIINATAVQAWCVQPMTAAQATELRASMPDEQRRPS